jgi:fumarylpyruvate hydrolase
MIHSVPDIISHLSRFYHLHAGDIILTGTPAGVGAVQAGDRLTGQIDGLPDIALTLMEPE